MKLLKYLFPILLVSCGSVNTSNKDAPPPETLPVYVQIDGTWQVDAYYRYQFEEDPPESGVYEDMELLADQIGPAVRYWGVVGLADPQKVFFGSYTRRLDDWLGVIEETHFSGSVDETGGTITAFTEYLDGNLELISYKTVTWEVVHKGKLYE